MAEADLDAIVHELLQGAFQGAPPSERSLLAARDGLSEREREQLERVFRALEPPASDEFAGAKLPERIGGYRILRRIGEGGMGVVYLAEEESLARPVALKLLRPELAGSARAVERLQREAQAIARLSHPSIVRVFAAGVSDGTPFIAMEWVPGASLQQILARGGGVRLPLPLLLRWSIDVARALQAAHEAGIVHRDVKPSNVRITPKGRALLVDFGLALTPDVTRTIGFRGTPHYAAPEQIEGAGEADARSDVYSLGVLLYEALTGRVPFDGESPALVFQRILKSDPIPPRRLTRELTRDLETLVLHALEKDPRHRYESAEQLALDLEAVLDLRAPSVRRPSRLRRLARRARREPGPALGVAGVAVGAVVLAGAPAWLRWRSGAQVELHLQHARVALAGGDFSEAAAGVERALGLRPESGEALALRAEVNARAEALALERARDEGRRWIERAQAELERLRDVGRQRAELARDLGELRAAVTQRPMSEVERKRLHAGEREELALAQSAEDARAAVHESLRQAARHDRQVDGSELLAQTYLESWQQARAERDPLAERFFLRLARENDAAGLVAREVEAEGTLVTAELAPGIELHLFRFEEHAEVVPGGEPRLVPVPLRDAPPACEPGARTLRLARDAGELRAGDLVLDIEGFPAADAVMTSNATQSVPLLARLVRVDERDVRELYDVTGNPSTPRPPEGEQRFHFERAGTQYELRAPWLPDVGIQVAEATELAELGLLRGVRARVFHAGEFMDVELPDGLELRRTAAPLWIGAWSLVGVTPLGPLALEQGSYLALLRAPACADARVPFVVRGGETTTIAAKLVESARIPPGFVPIAAGRVRPGAPEVAAFLLQEREVTFAEYFEFLNSPEILDEIEQHPNRLIRVPRDLHGNLVPQLAKIGGRWVVSEPWSRVPVGSVSRDDVEAYAAWRTERARAAGLEVEFFLPKAAELEFAARGVDEREFVHGSRFVPGWIKSALAREKARAEPTSSFPIDESPFGVFDLAGSASEFTSDVVSEGWICAWGGSWSRRMPYDFSLATRQEYFEVLTVAALGFRLAASLDR